MCTRSSRRTFQVSRLHAVVGHTGRPASMRCVRGLDDDDDDDEATSASASASAAAVDIDHVVVHISPVLGLSSQPQVLAVHRRVPNSRALRGWEQFTFALIRLLTTSRSCLSPCTATSTSTASTSSSCSGARMPRRRARCVCRPLLFDHSQSIVH